ncbi:MAG: metallophosphoesterase [Actinobacteria bacterium]|nr:metallophosphoesterase [Actinomycetota bacterium]
MGYLNVRPGSAKPECPKRPGSESELGFVRRPMVRWFDPHQLVGTAARVVASGVSSSYVDSRELQALMPASVYDHSDCPELWLDYVADLGDGWNATYTVARLLAQEELALNWDGEGRSTRRGRILVMGGDQVYPVPKRSEYQNRLIGPYQAAMPCVAAETPDLFAIPGSHDWYDGLINFTNVFCRGRSIGAWQTSQTRSYFALKLPHRWWLWGIDMQFGEYLDEVQLRYFSEITADEVEPGDSIVLCQAKEVGSGRKSDEVASDRSLQYLEREIIAPAGGRVALYLKSGRHHYCRYEEDGGSRQLITAGGGGAFMHPTQGLPDRSDPDPDAEQQRYRRAAVYPSAPDSKRLRKRVLLLPVYNLPLAAVFGGVQILLAFMLNLHLGNAHMSLGLDDLRRALWSSPTAFLLLLLIIVTVGLMVRLAHDASGAARLLLGLLHSLMLFATLPAVMIAASTLSSGVSGNAASLLVFLGFVAVLGGIGGVLGIAAYLWVANCFGFHGNETYAPLHHMDYKNFLRLHIDREGTLNVYPVGIDRVARKWKLCPDAPDAAPWFDPVGDELTPHLIEAPIRSRSQRSTPP